MSAKSVVDKGLGTQVLKSRVSFVDVENVSRSQFAYRSPRPLTSALVFWKILKRDIEFHSIPCVLRQARDSSKVITVHE